MNEKYTNFDDMPVMLNAADIAVIFKLSRSSSYKFLRTADFPTVKIGKTIRVSKDELQKWIAKESSVWHYATKPQITGLSF